MTTDVKAPPAGVTLPTVDPTTQEETPEIKILEFWDNYDWTDILHRHSTTTNIPTSLTTRVANTWKLLADTINAAHAVGAATTLQHRERLWKLLLATPQMLFHTNTDNPQKNGRTLAARTVADRITMWHDGAWAALQPPHTAPTKREVRYTNSRTRKNTVAPCKKCATSSRRGKSHEPYNESNDLHNSPTHRRYATP